MFVSKNLRNLFLYRDDYLVENSVERFADTLEDVMEEYWAKDVQKNLDNALEYAYTHYSWKKRIDQWIDFLDNLTYELDYAEEEVKKEVTINQKS